MDPKFNLHLPSGIENFEKLYEVEEIVPYGERDAEIVAKIKEKCSALPPSNREDEILYKSLCLYDKYVKKPEDGTNLFLSCVVCTSWASNKLDKVALPPRFQQVLNTAAEGIEDVSLASGPIWKDLSEELQRGLPAVTPFPYLNFLYPLIHLPVWDRKPVTELLAKSREDSAFSEFAPSTLAVSAVLAYASKGGFGRSVRKNFIGEVMKFCYFGDEKRKDELERCTYEMETLYGMLHPEKNQVGCCSCSLQ